MWYTAQTCSHDRSVERCQLYAELSVSLVSQVRNVRGVLTTCHELRVCVCVRMKNWFDIVPEPRRRRVSLCSLQTMKLLSWNQTLANTVSFYHKAWNCFSRAEDVYTEHLDLTLLHCLLLITSDVSQGLIMKSSLSICLSWMATQVNGYNVGNILFCLYHTCRPTRKQL